MLKKVRTAFYAILFLSFLLPGCVKNSDTPAQPYTSEAPAGTPTVLPGPTESSLTPVIPEATSSPVPEEELVPAENEQIITKKVFSSLVSPELKGRVMGSEGSEKARSMIQDLYSEMKLQPFNGDYLSPIYRDPFRNTPDTAIVKPDGYNVIGFLNGSDDKECLIISAHYDGSEAGTSALDNAGGIYGLLTIAEKLAAYNKDHIFKRDILFAAFDGEESGFIGSSYLADEINQRYERSILINLDCIGIRKSDSYMVIGNTMQFEALVDSLYRQLETYQFDTVSVDDTYASDHLPFEWQSIPAVTIGERNTAGIVHTSNDSADKVDLPEISRLSDVLYHYILQQSDSLYEIYDP